MHPFKSIFIHVYIWVVLVFSWALTYSIIPFFLDTNAKGYQPYYNASGLIFCWGTLLFNLYMSLEFVFLLRSIYSRVAMLTSDSTQPEGISSLQVLQSISHRSIGHAVTSSIAAFCYYYVESPFGVGIYGILIPIGMHVWFNMRWSQTSQSTADRFVFMNRDTRERLARRGVLSTVVRKIRALSVAQQSSRDDDRGITPISLVGGGGAGAGGGGDSRPVVMNQLPFIPAAAAAAAAAPLAARGGGAGGGRQGHLQPVSR
jgi:hypothetical protein